MAVDVSYSGCCDELDIWDCQKVYLASEETEVDFPGCDGTLHLAAMLLIEDDHLDCVHTHIRECSILIAKLGSMVSATIVHFVDTQVL